MTDIPKSSFGTPLKSLLPENRKREPFPRPNSALSDTFNRKTQRKPYTYEPGTPAHENRVLAIEAAAERFFAGDTVVEISKATGLPESELRKLINSPTGWRIRREENNLKITRQLHNLQRDRYGKALDSCLQVLERGVAKLNEPLEDDQGHPIRHPVTKDLVYERLSVPNIKKVAEIAGVLQVMLDNSIARGDDADARVPGQQQVMTVERVTRTLLKLQAVDPIGFGADLSEDDDDQPIDVTP